MCTKKEVASFCASFGSPELARCIRPTSYFLSLYNSMELTSRLIGDGTPGFARGEVPERLNVFLAALYWCSGCTVGQSDFKFEFFLLSTLAS